MFIVYPPSVVAVSFKIVVLFRPVV